jgi:sulfur-oxidizing protein SoxY
MADPVSRRGILAGAGLLALLPRAPARATPQAMQEAMHAIVGAAIPRAGKVRLDVPPLVENGNTVPLTVSVDSAMTDTDHVKAIHILNQKNPQPHVISIALGPRAGRATVLTRIKLADSQQIVAIAEMNDGSFWTGAADVVVTLAACVEDEVR